MLSYYCLKCKKSTESNNPKVASAKNGRIMLLSKCAVYNSKNSEFIKEQEACGLLGSLGIKASFNQILLLGSLLCFKSIKWME